MCPSILIVDLAWLDARLTRDSDEVEAARCFHAACPPIEEPTLVLRRAIDTALDRHAANQLGARVLDRLPDAVLVVGKTGAIVLSNRAARDMFELRSEPAAQLHELMPGSDVVELRAQLGARTTRRVQARRRGGEPFLAELMVRPLDDADRLILVLRDVSGQRQVEQQLARACQLEIAGRVASGVAHDLNNVLSTIWMATHMLHQSLPAAVPGLLDELTSAVELGAALTTRLLSVARSAPSEPRAVAVNEVLRAIARLVRRSIDPRVEIDLELDPRGGAVRIGATQLDQAVLNLTLNAGRAMPEGGRLTIRSIAIEGEGEQVAIEVEDTGVGIDASTQRRMFEPFFSTLGDAGGTGLGLAIVKDIVEQAGGLLEFETKLGRGTHFRMIFPRCQTATIP